MSELVKVERPEVHIKVEVNSITTELKNYTSDNYLKICITLILTDKINNKKTIVDIKNLCNNSKCIYSRLERNIDNIFPEDIEKYISKIKSDAKYNPNTNLYKGVSKFINWYLNYYNYKYKKRATEIVALFY